MIVSNVSNKQGASTRIRAATAEDAQLLAEMGAETFYDAYAPDLPAGQLREFLPGMFSLELQTAELADPANCFLIAEIDRETAGYAMLTEAAAPGALTGKRAVKIPRIYLQQSFTGRGIGSTLMRACLEEAAKGGFEAIWLEVWEKNVRAQAFYRKWGFEQIGETSFQFGTEMQTDLVFYRPVSTLNQGKV